MGKDTDDDVRQQQHILDWDNACGWNPSCFMTWTGSEKGVSELKRRMDILQDFRLFENIDRRYDRLELDATPLWTTYQNEWKVTWEKITAPAGRRRRHLREKRYPRDGKVRLLHLFFLQQHPASFAPHKRCRKTTRGAWISLEFPLSLKPSFPSPLSCQSPYRRQISSVRCSVWLAGNSEGVRGFGPNIRENTFSQSVVEGANHPGSTLLPSFTRSMYSVEETMTTTIGGTQLFNGDPCLLREICDEMKGVMEEKERDSSETGTERLALSHFLFFLVSRQCGKCPVLPAWLQL